MSIYYVLDTVQSAENTKMKEKKVDEISIRDSKTQKPQFKLTVERSMGALKQECLTRLREECGPTNQ